MVFLGGAVLANIVSGSIYHSADKLLTLSRWPTRRTCGYQSKSGRSRARERWRSWARDSASKGHSDCTGLLHINLWSYKSIACGPRKPHSVLPSEAVVSACACRDTITSPIMTSHHIHKRPALIPSLFLVPSTSGGLYLGVVQPHGRSTDTVSHCCPNSSTCRAAV
jgi:hypothetical protein